MIDVRARLIAVVIPEEDEFSVTSLARLLGISYHVVFRAIRTGELPYPDVREHNRYVFTRQMLRDAQEAAVKR